MVAHRQGAKGLRKAPRGPLRNILDPTTTLTTVLTTKNISSTSIAPHSRAGRNSSAIRVVSQYRPYHSLIRHRSRTATAHLTPTFLSRATTSALGPAMQQSGPLYSKKSAQVLPVRRWRLLLFAGVVRGSRCGLVSRCGRAHSLALTPTPPRDHSARNPLGRQRSALAPRSC